MKVAWCTPFTKASAIGHVSALVVQSMRDALGWQVDIFYPTGAGGRRHPDRGTELDAHAAEMLADYDKVVYNLGDNPANHSPLVALLRRVEGLVVLHDISLVHLLLPDLVHGPEQAVRREVLRWYGPDAAQAVGDLRRDAVSWARDPANIRAFPMVELVLENSTGVVTHSEYAAAELQRGYAGDIWTLPLPREADDEANARVDLPRLDDRTIILQAGVPNKNKHIPVVVEAFDSAGIADRAQLVICGYGTEAEFAELQREVRLRSLDDSVSLLGRVSDEVLTALRWRAPIATVLRYPFGEAASAVLLDSMAYGMAVVTVNGGQYAEVPADTVARVDVPPRAGDIAPILRSMIDDPEGTAALGRRAARYVRERHSGGGYAMQIARVLQQAGGYRRRRLLAEQLAATLRSLGFGAQDEIVASVASDAFELFSAEPTKTEEIYGAAGESDARPVSPAVSPAAS